jgi:hypothetical protein
MLDVGLSAGADSLLSFADWSRVQARVVIREMGLGHDHTRNAGIPRLIRVQSGNRRQTTPALLRHPFNVA